MPIFVDPDIPVWAATKQLSPISTLWATCIRLSSLAPFRIIVEPKVARSIVEFAPISTKSSIITLPTWGIFL